MNPMIERVITQAEELTADMDRILEKAKRREPLDDDDRNILLKADFYVFMRRSAGF